MSANILNKKIKGRQTLYLVQGDLKTGRRAKWATLSQIPEMSKDVLEYQLSRSMVNGVSQKRMKEMIVQEPNWKESISRENYEYQQISMIQGPQVYQIDDEQPNSNKSNTYQSIKNRLRKSDLIQIQKQQFQSQTNRRKCQKIKTPQQQPKLKQAFKIYFAYKQQDISYYSVYYKDKTTQLFSSTQMMQKHPSLFIKYLQQRL